MYTNKEIIKMIFDIEILILFILLPYYIIKHWMLKDIKNVIIFIGYFIIVAKITHLCSIVINNLEAIIFFLFTSTIFLFYIVRAKHNEILTGIKNIVNFKIEDNIINWLSTTKCSNGEPFIKKCNGNLIWLQNKQTARVLLTHDCVRGDLTKSFIVKQSEKLFIGKDNKPLKLSKNDERLNNTDTDNLINFLNTKKNTTPIIS